ncbi:DUF6904 family protein [Parvicella tangerina]|uniref:Uncharacterized protein n=1 Tax=Parvicella tangerina TaxID=2829795 RepID=A0A916NEK1_9FLAO|nr:hypothetical protein [Parvicella tangerina]CAG5086857.1 hypothetical protein CRYO30217_03309 [Parvicella tangerina]
MIYIIPTEKGLGVEIWGTYKDLDNLYLVIGKFWNNTNYLNKKGFESRDKLISGFSYEIRKAKEGSRLKRTSSHFTYDQIEYFGTKISWVHFLFSMTSIKYNMGINEINKFDISMILLLEFWLESAMKKYDEVGAKNLIGFIDGGIYAANDNIYHFMRCINMEYFKLKGGKRAFRKLPELLKLGIFNTNEYLEYQKFLTTESKRLNCEIINMEINDDHVDYENIKW